jgi:prepilin-type N-terminal cleavage/methylation domain-containing protein
MVNSLPGILLRHGRQPRAARRRAFTLVELLAVLLIIAILLSIILGAALYLIKTARSRRSAFMADTLRMALVNYRHEYGHWPVPDAWGSSIPNAHIYVSDGESFDSSRFTVYTNDTILVVTTPADNATLFNMLLGDNGTDNPKHVRFFDETTILTTTPEFGRQTLYRTRKVLPSSPPSSGTYPFVYIMRNGGTEYFHVVIDFDQEKAHVWRPADI